MQNDTPPLALPGVAALKAAALEKARDKLTVERAELGDMRLAALRRELDARAGHIDECYRKEDDESRRKQVDDARRSGLINITPFSIAGHIELVVPASADGSVGRVQIRTSTFMNKRFEDCLQGQLTGLVLPPGERQELNVQMAFPAFRGAESKFTSGSGEIHGRVSSGTMQANFDKLAKARSVEVCAVNVTVTKAAEKAGKRLQESAPQRACVALTEGTYTFSLAPGFYRLGLSVGNLECWRDVGEGADSDVEVSPGAVANADINVCIDAGGSD